ncbi:MAG: hypothetical protein HYZ29_20295 [Myxococcales bacterium]|nr:hypothetical protein [Myxococcales bacterium]
MALVVFATRPGQEAQRFVLGVPGAVAIAIGVVFAFLRKGLVLDGEARRVMAWWRWLFLRGEAHFDVGKRRFMVERTSTRSKESGTTYFYRIMLGEHLLHTISEHQGDKEGAEALAKQMAAHLGTTFDGHRDCRDMKRRDAFRAKYALAPLGIMVALMFAAAIGYLVLPR